MYCIKYFEFFKIFLHFGQGEKKRGRTFRHRWHTVIFISRKNWFSYDFREQEQQAEESKTILTLFDMETIIFPWMIWKIYISHVFNLSAWKNKEKRMLKLIEMNKILRKISEASTIRVWSRRIVVVELLRANIPSNLSW